MSKLWFFIPAVVTFALSLFIASTSTTVVLPLWIEILIALAAGLMTYSGCWFWLTFAHNSLRGKL